jgi:hypothetical protein
VNDAVVSRTQSAFDVATFSSVDRIIRAKAGRVLSSEMEMRSLTDGGETIYGKTRSLNGRTTRQNRSKFLASDFRVSTNQLPFEHCEGYLSQRTGVAIVDSGIRCKCKHGIL